MQSYADIKKLFFQVEKTLRNKKMNKREGIALLDSQHALLLNMYDSTDDIELKQEAVKLSVKYMLPKLEFWMKNNDSDPLFLAEVTDLYEKSYAFAARMSFHHFIKYIDWDRPEKSKPYAKREEALRAAVYYLNQMVFDEEFIYFVASFPPNFGKSYLGNYFSAWLLGLDPDGSILRISYSEELVTGFSRQIKGIIQSDRFSDVFPRFKAYKDDMFEVSKETGWKLKDADTIVSHYARTRAGAITGVRAKSAIMIDDITKGQEEANNDHLHNSMWDKYTTEWSNRKENEAVKEIFLGTMWNNNDLLAKIQKEISSYGQVKPSKFRFVEEVWDGNSLIGVIIKVPLLDALNRSTAPSIYSHKRARRIRDTTDEFLFSCVYQQNPIPPTGRVFAYEHLQTYSQKGKRLFFHNEELELSKTAKASLDPVRKGHDKIAMPIFKTAELNDGDGQTVEYHVLVDVIYGGKSMDEVYDELVEKIILHRITHFVLENNTDVSLRALINMKLEARGYTDVTIIEVFNTANKFMRIKDENHLIRTRMIFPEQDLFPPNSAMGKFMETFTTYSYDVANAFDDAPDSVALYSKHILRDRRTTAKAVAFDRSLLGW